MFIDFFLLQLKEESETRIKKNCFLIFVLTEVGNQTTFLKIKFLENIYF